MRAALVVVVLAACGGKSSLESDAAIDAAPDAELRSYRLASSGSLLDPTTGPVLADADLATDVDVINIHQDYYGVPWTAFAANTAPAAAWTAKMEDLASRAHATGKDIFLALAPLNGDRNALAPNVVETTGGFTLDPVWKPVCYDLATAGDGATLRTAYARYVDYMVKLFNPRWTNIAVEVSLFHLLCGSAWDGMVSLERDAYDAAKAAQPTTIAFPSIQIDIVYGRRGCPMGMTEGQCYDTEYAALANLKRDRFAVSTYPWSFVGYDHPADVPADWLTKGAARGGERLFVAETGWLGTNLVVTDETSQCLTVFDDPPSEGAEWLDRLVADAKTNDVEVINWISNRDFLPAQVMTDCPCTYSTTWCPVIDFVRSFGADAVAKRDKEVNFKNFGTMGIRDYSGIPRQPIYDRWTAARVLDVTP